MSIRMQVISINISDFAVCIFYTKEERKIVCVGRLGRFR